MPRLVPTAMRRLGSPRSTLAGLVIAAMTQFPLAGETTARPQLTPTSFSELPGWGADKHAEALGVFRRSCAEILGRGAAFGRQIVFGGRREDWLDVCRAASDASDAEARRFFEARFVPYAVVDPERRQGLFTGYYEPEAEGSLERAGPYQVPLYARPKDLVAFDAAARKKTGLGYGRLVGGKPQAYPTRREIEQGALAGKGLELVWLKDWADAFFMQVQGSGRVRLKEGGVLRLGFAAKTGLPYTAIGAVLIDQGEIAREDISMQSIRAWMTLNPDRSRELMWANKSYVFFRKLDVDDPALGPPGAQKVALTPYRSLAVDRGIWAFGTPVWLDTTYPVDSGGTQKPLRSLLVAQDTGTAIKGYVRGDVFWGSGETAAFIAGHMKSPGRMVVLLPREVARRLELPAP